MKMKMEDKTKLTHRNKLVSEMHRTKMSETRFLNENAKRHMAHKPFTTMKGGAER